MTEATQEPPRRAINAPTVVLTWIVVLIAIQAVRGFLTQRQDLNLLLTFAFIPARFAPPPGLPPGIFPGGRLGDVWTFVTHLFLHGDWMHLAVNGFWMLAFGSPLARRFGAVRFVLLSLLAGTAGAALHLHLYWGELVPMIGASAAISGQMAATVRFLFAGPGGLAAAAHRDPRSVPAQPLRRVLADPRALTFLLVWVGMNVVFGATDLGLAGENVRIAWQAHLGGFAAGLVLFGLLDPRRKEQAAPR
jgi:membrane associated rhomboid family serine protease